MKFTERDGLKLATYSYTYDDSGNRTRLEKSGVDQPETIMYINITEYETNGETFSGKPNIPKLSEIECPLFRTIIYQNGVRMIFSEKKTEKYLKVSDIYWGICEPEELTEVAVVPMSANEIDHIKKELAYQ